MKTFRDESFVYVKGAWVSRCGVYGVKGVDEFGRSGAGGDGLLFSLLSEGRERVR